MYLWGHHHVLNFFFPSLYSTCKSQNLASLNWKLNGSWLFPSSPTQDTPDRLDFFKTVRVRFVKFVDAAAWAHGKERRAQHHKCLLFFLSEWYLNQSCLKSLHWLLPWLKLYKNPQVCVSNTNLCSLKWYLLLMAINMENSLSLLQSLEILLSSMNLF